MKAKYRIKKNEEFQKIISKKKSKANKTFIIYFSNKALDYARVGISVGKKLGNAVERNLYKRRLRMMIQEIFNHDTYPYDIIIIVRNNFIKQSYKENKNSLENMLKTSTIK
ncbi:MAG: ribonuclease P protein component [Erysipelotrichaceae bacterium]|jgi:ribonuclease P protein component|nr:ribonuclease P protein component [Erysipelotrichaceae bacterium]